MLNVRLEEVPIDEIDITPGEFLCPVVHFDREPAKIFGISFVIKIRSNELMTDVRDRLRKKLHDVSDAEFTKYKFALLSKEKVSQVSNKTRKTRLFQLQLCRYIEFNNGEKVNLADMSNHTTGGLFSNFSYTPPLPFFRTPGLHRNRSQSAGAAFERSGHPNPELIRTYYYSRLCNFSFSRSSELIRSLGGCSGAKFRLLHETSLCSPYLFFCVFCISGDSSFVFCLFYRFPFYLFLSLLSLLQSSSSE